MVSYAGSKLSSAMSKGKKTKKTKKNTLANALSGDFSATQGQATTTKQPSGVFDPNKGAYVKASGQVYPTDNPNFVPGAAGQSTENIVFNKDNSVWINGVKMTKEQYNQSLKNQSYTNQVQANQQQLKQQEIASQIGLSPEEIYRAQQGLTEAPVDIGQAITAGTVKNAPNLIKNIATGAGVGATTGAIGGSVVPGVGTAVGAVGLGIVGGIAAAISTVWGGVQGNIASQQRGQIAASKDVLSAAKTNMRQLAILAAKDPANSDQYVEAYNTQLAMVYKAQRQIQLETQGNLNKFVDDGTEIKAEFDLFLMPNGYADNQRRKLELAITSGVVPDFTAEDLAGASENV